MYRQRKEDKKAILPPLVSDVELATLREIPRGNFVQSNALYASTLQNDPDDSTLPKIRREQITLAKFLGSGAFGEVSEINKNIAVIMELCILLYIFKFFRYSKGTRRIWRDQELAQSQSKRFGRELRRRKRQSFFRKLDL